MTIPDPSPPYAFPAGLAYDWVVVEHDAATVDAAATGIGNLETFDIVVNGGGGPGFAMDAGFATTFGGGFTFFAP